MPDLFKDSLPKPKHDQKTVGTSAVQLFPHKVGMDSGILLKALAANTGTIYVGSSDQVTASNGFPLAATEQLPLPVEDLQDVWFIATEASQTIAWIGQ